jgi:hypothetical protein
MNFLSFYGVLHALQVAGITPSVVARLSTIPLFAAILASGVEALAAFAITLLFIPDPVRVLRRAPRFVAVLWVLFALEMALLP